MRLDRWPRLLIASLLTTGAAASSAGCGDDDAPANADAAVTVDAATADAAGHPCDGVPDCTRIEAGATYEQVQTALIEVEPGGTIGFAAGTYSFDRELSLAVDDVTIRGAGIDATILSFAEQKESGAQGLLVTGDDFVAEDFAIQDSRGDGLKVEGTDGVTIRRVRAEWTGGPSPSNGAYGLYPVQCTNVLIEDSVVKGASDAGFYVGQSEDIIVRRNHVEGNVAGIEIENCNRADVHDNMVTGNTGGILVFNLPGLQVMNGTSTRVYDNTVIANNLDNFAPPGNIVGKIPRGSGFIGLAAHNVEIFGNTFDDHDAGNMLLVSYTVTGVEWDDPTYVPDSDTVYVHDNTFGGVSDDPTGELGALLILAMAEIEIDPVVVPDVVFDGNVAAANRDPETGATLPAFEICLANNGDADFANLHWPLGDPTLPDVVIGAHACTHTPLPAVELDTP